MALTKEQFQKATEAGYTTEQIASFEQKRMQEEQPVKEQPIDSKRPSVGATILRKIVRTTGLEQLKTADYLSGKMPEVIEGESYWDYQKRVNKILEPREREIMQKGALAQLETPATGLFLMSGMKAPWQTLKFMAKAYLVNTGASVVGLNDAIENIKQPELKDAAEIAKVFAIGNLASQKWSPPQAAKTLTKFAGRMVNSLIKPRNKEFNLGMNPGETIAKEKIVAVSMEDLQTKVQQKIDFRMQEISEIRNNPKYMDTKVNASSVLNPLVETYSTLRKLGQKTHSSEIGRLESMLSDIKGTGKDLKGLSVPEAYELKNAIALMRKFDSNTKANQSVNIALGKAYHNIDKAIDKAIPTLEKPNSIVANLISAREAIDNRIHTLSKTEPFPTVMKLLDLPFAMFRSVLGKTLVSKALATERQHMTAMDLLKNLVK